MDLGPHIPKGVLTGSTALVASGMQHEFAAQITILSNLLGSSLILRAGHPGNYDTPNISPKPMSIKTKTSQRQGFLNGFLAIDHFFSKADPFGNVADIKAEDLTKIQLPITNPEHQHAIGLRVHADDIIKQLSPEGDLEFDKLENGQLFFKFKCGRGDSRHRDELRFVIKLADATDVSLTYSRSWNIPTSAQISNVLEKLGTDPNLFIGKEFTLKYQLNSTSELKAVRVMARTPTNLHELQEALASTHDQVLAKLKENYSNAKLKQKIAAFNYAYEQIVQNTCAFPEALNLLGEDNLEILYNFPKVARVITSDWDCLVFGNPVGTNKQYLNNCYTSTDEGRRELLKNAEAFFNYFKTRVSKQQSAVSPVFRAFLNNLTFEQLIARTDITKVGIINASEFVFQQLINLSYLLPNSPLGPGAVYDHNIKDLIQHGPDMKSPKGPECDCPWIMFYKGLQIYGTKQKQLTEFLLANNILQELFFEVHPATDFQSVVSENGIDIGWGAIVAEQIKLGQPVSEKTKQAYHAQHKSRCSIQHVQSLMLRIAAQECNFQTHQTALKPASLRPGK